MTSPIDHLRRIDMEIDANRHNRSVVVSEKSRQEFTAAIDALLDERFTLRPVDHASVSEQAREAMREVGK